MIRVKKSQISSVKSVVDTSYNSVISAGSMSSFSEIEVSCVGPSTKERIPIYLYIHTLIFRHFFSTVSEKEMVL